MKFVDEFRNPELIVKSAEEIRRLTDPRRHYRLMESTAATRMPFIALD
jgi:hydrogenase expression/formation protein HypD